MAFPGGIVECCASILYVHTHKIHHTDIIKVNTVIRKGSGRTPKRRGRKVSRKEEVDTSSRYLILQVDVYVGSN